ncbi:hypothetical protein CFC21_003665 [Triticum aestivum]|uniref:FAD-binding FR-type domain-containing protein n=1 Tax=Triticum aestivum TaxID=4565 RepID=A0A3B5Y4W7_WHEAT|nr:respiratory burst oxidase homolog protein C-like [Triticum aestivum]KAF6985847.1 hypothetical protein CFC21_003665 [Triticum aestivum]
MRNGEGTGGGTAGDIVEAGDERDQGPRFVEPVSASHGLQAPRDGSDDDDDSLVEITLDLRDDDSIVVVKQETLAKRPPSYGHGVLRDASARVEQAPQELRRLTASSKQGQGGAPSCVGRSMTATAHLLKFLSRVDASAGWAAVERRFDEEAKDGLLHRSKFAKCIGTKELAFAGELFDALARRRHISGESISKPELLEFWDQISDRSFDGRLQIFMDMTEKDGDGRVLEEDIKEMIMLSANANNLTMDTQQSQKYARLMMEELDPDDLGYIQLFEVESLLLQTASRTKPTGTTLSSKLSMRLHPTTAEPSPLRRWYRRASYSLGGNWRWRALYACERMARPLRGSARSVAILEVAVFPDPASAMSMRFSKPQGFSYKSGQYIFLKCPAVSRSQWHPFYITSAPRDEHVSVHIRAVGDWAKELHNVFLKVCPTPTKEKSEMIRVEYDLDSSSNPSFPKVVIDGPYSAPTQDYKKYDTVLLVGTGVGAAPMISLVKDIVNNMKQPNCRDGESRTTQTCRAYFYWITREQGSFEWFRGFMDEMVETGDEGVIELHNYYSSIYEEGDTRSALISLLQSLNHAKHDIDMVSGARVKTHFGRPNWWDVYERIALRHREQRVGVFYCGTPVLTKELSELAHNFSRKTSTKFEFYNANF